MTSTLLDLSGKIDDLTIQICEQISLCSHALNIPFFVVGATARDLILTHGYDVPVTRATQDIDFGVQVETWEQYDSLKNHLLSSDNFASDALRHRLIYKKIHPVDIVPFGSLANASHIISWPPHQENKMSVLGFKEAYQHRLTVRLRSLPDLDIPFASLSGLVLLKIISWNDAHLRRSKDATDIYFIIRHYLDAGNQQRLYDENNDLMNAENLDYERAGARLLGRDIAIMVTPPTKTALTKILDREIQKKDQSKLALDMIKGRTMWESNDFEHALQLLDDLKKGIDER